MGCVVKILGDPSLPLSRQEISMAPMQQLPELSGFLLLIFIRASWCAATCLPRLLQEAEAGLTKGAATPFKCQPPWRRRRGRGEERKRQAARGGENGAWLARKNQQPALLLGPLSTEKEGKTGGVGGGTTDSISPSFTVGISLLKTINIIRKRLPLELQGFAYSRRRHC